MGEWDMTDKILEIARTWDGSRLPPGDHAILRLSAASEGLRVAVEAPYYGDPPPPTPPGPTDQLWNYEVVELFILGDGPNRPYLEIELSPHGHHLVLQLEGVRCIVESKLPLDYRAEIRGDRFRGDAVVPRSYLPPAPHRINAYAIHGRGDARRHLAMEPVPGPAPDFHRLESFVPVDLP